VNPPLKYLDSSIIVSYQLGPTDRFYSQAKRIIEVETKQRRLTGLVSMLTLMEVIDVIRRRVTERTGRATLDALDDPSKNSCVKAESDRKIKGLIQVLTQMEEQGLVLFGDFTPLDLKNIMNDVYSYSKTYFGMVKKYFMCQVCKATFEHYSYKGLGWIDLMHAFLALGFFADGLITADRSFAHLSADSKFSSLVITVI
jgi:predicted nucleic acid-binding protein